MPVNIQVEAAEIYRDRKQHIQDVRDARWYVGEVAEYRDWTREQMEEIAQAVMAQKTAA